MTDIPLYTIVLIEYIHFTSHSWGKGYAYEHEKEIRYHIDGIGNSDREKYQVISWQHMPPLTVIEN